MGVWTSPVFSNWSRHDYYRSETAEEVSARACCRLSKPRLIASLVELESLPMEACHFTLHNSSFIPSHIPLQGVGKLFGGEQLAFEFGLGVGIPPR